MVPTADDPRVLTATDADLAASAGTLNVNGMDGPVMNGNIPQEPVMIAVAILPAQ